jgi:hypothetical protein
MNVDEMCLDDDERLAAADITRSACYLIGVEKTCPRTQQTADRQAVHVVAEAAVDLHLVASNTVAHGENKSVSY